MASKFTVSGSNLTIDFNWTGPTAMVTNIAVSCAEELWNRGKGEHGTEESPILFSSLTNTQRLTIIENYLKDVIIDMANQNKVNKAVDATKTTEATTNYSI